MRVKIVLTALALPVLTLLLLLSAFPETTPAIFLGATGVAFFILGMVGDSRHLRQCPKCGRPVRVPASDARLVRCPHCGQTVVAEAWPGPSDRLASALGIRTTRDLDERKD